MNRLLGPSAPALKVVAEMCLLFLEPLLVDELGCAKVLVVYDSSRGLFSMASLQDPHTLQTFLHFEHALATLSSGDFPSDWLYRAKLNLFKKLDHDLVTEEKGLSSVLWGVKGEQQETFRQAALAVDGPAVS